MQSKLQKQINAANVTRIGYKKAEAAYSAKMEQTEGMLLTYRKHYNDATDYARGFIDEILPRIVKFNAISAGWTRVNHAIDSDYTEIQQLKDQVNSSLPTLQTDVSLLKINQMTPGEIDLIAKKAIVPLSKRVTELETISKQAQSSTFDIENLKKQVLQLLASVDALKASIPAIADKLDLVDQEVKSIGTAIADESFNPDDDAKKGERKKKLKRKRTCLKNGAQKKGEEAEENKGKKRTQKEGKKKMNQKRKKDKLKSLTTRSTRALKQLGPHNQRSRE